MHDKILIPFAPILVESTRSIGYSFEAALADIIDNSISSFAKDIQVNFLSKEPAWLCVQDDGEGMTEEELETAMRYGSKSSLDTRSATDLGRFGLGLKTASLSQCRCLTVATKKAGEVSAARWDLDHIIAKENWVLIKMTDEDARTIPGIEWLDAHQSGTIVVWQSFDRLLKSAMNPEKAFDERIELAREHIALVFHRFLGDEILRQRLSIKFNGDPVVPLDPFLTNHPATQPLTEQILRIDGEEIKVKPYILPFASKLTEKDIKKVGSKEDLRQRQGFYVYRNRRLIIWGTWFRLIKNYELNKLTRIRVDIPNSLDSIWEIDIKKSSASLPNLLKKNLVSIVEKAVGRSERVYRYRGRSVQEDNIIHIWNKIDNRGKFQYLVNRDLPIYKILEGMLDDEQAALMDSLIKMIEDAFPYSAVYYDLAKKENSLTEGQLDEDEVYSAACQTIEQLVEIGQSITPFLNSLDKTDFFMHYPTVIDRIRKEYKND